MGRTVQQNHSDPRSPSLGAGRGSRDVHCRALPQVITNLRGDRTDSAGRILTLIGINGGVEPFEFISFRHAQSTSRQERK